MKKWRVGEGVEEGTKTFFFRGIAKELIISTALQVVEVCMCVCMGVENH